MGVLPQLEPRVQSSNLEAHPQSFGFMASLQDLIESGTREQVLAVINAVPTSFRDVIVEYAICCSNQPNMQNLRAILDLYPAQLQNAKLALGFVLSEQYDLLQTAYDWGWRPDRAFLTLWNEEYQEMLLDDPTEEETRELHEHNQRVQYWLATHP